MTFSSLTSLVASTASSGSRRQLASASTQTWQRQRRHAHRPSVKQQQQHQQQQHVFRSTTAAVAATVPSSVHSHDDASFLNIARTTAAALANTKDSVRARARKRIAETDALGEAVAFSQFLSSSSSSSSSSSALSLPPPLSPPLISPFALPSESVGVGDKKALRDQHGRQHTYLRISLTEQCNLRCVYCMPEQGPPLLPTSASLTAEEIGRLARMFVRHGVDKIRLTGGEPTIRADLLDICRRLNALKRRPSDGADAGGLKQIGITTNGLLLTRLLPRLADEGGVTHINVSLDTLDADKFERMTRRPQAGLRKVLDGIDLALRTPGIEAVKINVVVLRGVNDTDDVLRFVEWAKDKPVVLRFIEYMPFDGNRWQRDSLVPFSELLERIANAHGGLHALERLDDDANDTSKHWRVRGHQSRLGFITSMTQHFCATCNRLRITADGHIKVCLFDNTEVSLRDALRSSGTGTGVNGHKSTDADAHLLHIVAAAVQHKHARHGGQTSLQSLADASSGNRSMLRIGG